MSLKGKKVVIIGGSAGIGKATARAAAEAGARVVIASRSEENLVRAEEDIGVPGVEHCVFDVRDARSMDYCLEQISPFDHLAITVADVRAVSFLDVDLEEAREMFDTKFWGPFTAVQQAAPCLNEGGSITLFSGLAAHKPVRGLSVIAAANGAVEALARSLALELSPLRVNAVAPAYVDTHGMDDERRDAIARTLPAGRVGAAEDVAHGVLFLMENPFVTGTVFYIDGGNLIL